MLDGFLEDGSVYRKRFHFFKQRLDTDEAVERLAAHDKVTVRHLLGSAEISSLDELRTLDTLEGKAIDPDVASDQAAALRTMARGLAPDDGVYAGNEQLGPFETCRALNAGQSVTVQVGDREQQVGSLADLQEVYKKSLHAAGLAEGVPDGKHITIRHVGEEKADTLAAIDRLAFSFPWSPSDILGALQRPEYAATLAMCGGGALGACLVEYGGEQPDAGLITSLAVIPQAQGHHVGERLLVDALLDIRAKGYPHAFLEVDVTNTRAQRLYEKVGFQKVETLPNYYADEGHDGYLMELKDLQSPAVGHNLTELKSR